MESVHKVVPNNELLRDLIALVKEGKRVTLPVRGNSMQPFIIGDRDSVELVGPAVVSVGDVVLAWINGDRYVIHRVIRIYGENFDQIQLMGDGNLTDNEYCHISDIKAKAEYIIGGDGSRRYIYSRKMVLLSRIWWYLRPLRRIILAVYRRTWLKFLLRKK